MTLINNSKVSLENFKKEYYYEKFIIFLFSFLPISLILGNSIINLNILIIDLLFLFICFYQKKWSWIKDKYFYFFMFFWIYLIINSTILANEILGGIDAITQQNVFPQKESTTRSIGFIRFVIFVFAVQYFFINLKKKFYRVFHYWSIIIFIVLIDIIFESIFGFNILGNVSDSPKRIVSFFDGELIVGSFLLGFSFIAASFLLKSAKNDLNKKILSNIFLILSIICIYLSGERSNLIKAIFVASLMILIMNNSYLYLKKKYIFLLVIIGIIFPTLISENIYSRQVQIFNNIIERGINLKEHIKEDRGKYFGLGYIKHFAHYETAWKMFKDYPISGVGNRKFRYVCHDKKYFNPEIKMTDIRCSNHPHQTHLEILSEEGILGYLIIIFTIFHILFNSFKVFCKTNDITHLTSILFVVVFFIPLLPSGSFFSTFNASIFWINFSFVYAFLKTNND